MTTSTIDAQPSRATLAKASLAALAGATAILTLFVLPAETGYDPTGLGGLLGLTGMSQAAAEESATPVPVASAQSVTAAAAQNKASIARTTPWRTDERTLTLAPHSGIELKATMGTGDSLVFRWAATGPLKMDMHGEPPNAREDEFTSYWKEKSLTGAQGSFTASFDGNHGWYWRNKGDVPVTIKINTAGFYRDLHIPRD